MPWVGDLQFRDLVDDVVVLPRPASSKIGDKFRALQDGAAELRAYAEKHGAWDIGYSLPNSFSAAFLLWRSGVKARIGYEVDGRGILLNEGRRWNADAGRHRAQAYVDLLAPSQRPKRPVRDFWGLHPENDLDPGVPGELKNFDVARFWPKADTLEPSPGPYWVLSPGATAESRRWPPEFFIRLAQQVFESTGMVGYIVGGPAEAVMAQELMEKVNDDDVVRLIDVTASCSVPGLWKLFRGSNFTVCNESGLAHVAALCGAFVQIVCGAADPMRTCPLGPGRVQVAVNPVECWPCERNTCMQPPAQKIQCLRGIRPSTVWEEIQRGVKLAALIQA